MAGATVAIVGIAANVIGGMFGAGAAKKRERAAKKERDRLQRKLTSLENNRQAIIDPTSGVSNLSGLAQDLSSNLSNPYANLKNGTLSETVCCSFEGICKFIKLEAAKIQLIPIFAMSSC